MILGVVSVQGLPTIILPIAGQDWPATIDTGFNGDLELPDALRDTLNAHFVGRATVALAGGQSVEEEVDFPFGGRVVQAEATLCFRESYSSRNPLAARIFFADQLCQQDRSARASMKGRH